MVEKLPHHCSGIPVEFDGVLEHLLFDIQFRAIKQTFLVQVVLVFLYVTQCNMVDTYRHYGGRCYLHFDISELSHEEKTSTEQGNKEPRTGAMSE